MEPAKTPEKNSFVQTIIGLVIGVVATYFVQVPFDKARHSDSELLTKVNGLETRMSIVERTQDRADERMLNVKASVDDIKRTQQELLDELKKYKK